MLLSYFSKSAADNEEEKEDWKNFTNTPDEQFSKPLENKSLLTILEELEFRIIRN